MNENYFDDKSNHQLIDHRYTAISPISLRKQFERDGYIVCRSAIDAQQLNRLNNQVDKWVEESRQHDKNYGKTLDNKARFDLQPEHSFEVPMLRRVANPVDISDVFRSTLLNGPIVDQVTNLIGPDVKFHHCKLNNKPPGSNVEVHYHQDHAFDPHTNDDIAVALLMLDDMTEENGCLRLVPGSHRRRFSHYQNDEFVGRIRLEDYPSLRDDAIPITGSAGDLIIQHTWMVHGGDANRSTAARRMLICDYAAADAVALTPVQMPSQYTGYIVAGTAIRQARLTQHFLELPPKYEDDSFFGVQQGNQNPIVSTNE